MGNITVVRASAGSGKTYRLAYEYVRKVIDNPLMYRHILAVTFTNKATEEMKSRIIREIHLLAEGAGSPYLKDLLHHTGLSAEQVQERARVARTKILHDYSHFTILTIDKFFQRIIRSFIRELGLDLNFTLELQTDTLLESAADKIIDEISVNESLRTWIMRFVEEKMEESKQWDIRREIKSLGTELFTERYKNRRVSPASKKELHDIIGNAVAQTKKIENSLQNTSRQALDLIETAGLSVDDFAYGSGGCLGYFIKLAAGTVEPYKQRVRDALASTEKWGKKTSPKKIAVQQLVPKLQSLLQQVCGLYDRHERYLKTTKLLAENYRSFALLTDLEEKIAVIGREQHIMPISETNILLHNLIAGNDTPFIYEKVGNTFSHFMIDEFQDTSLQQWINFLPLLENAMAQHSRSPVLLVGDVKQSIYRWRGGEWQILGQQVQQQFPSLDEDTLESNYRSEGLVVHFNNQLIEQCVRLDNDSLNAQIDEAFEKGLLTEPVHGELKDMILRAYERHSQKPERPDDRGYVRVTCLPKSKSGGQNLPRSTDPHPEVAVKRTVSGTEPAETTKPGSTTGSAPGNTPYDQPDRENTVHPVIELVEELQRRGYAPEDIAILVRRKKEGIDLANALLAYKSEHPDSSYTYEVITQEALLIGNSPVNQFIMAVFGLAVDPNDTIKRAVYNRYLDRPFSCPIPDEELQCMSNLRLTALEDAFNEILIRFKLAARTENIAYLQALEDQIHHFANTKVADIPLFIKWWEETGSQQSLSLPDKSSAITIVTIHKSKGLEYKAVILPYCDWELLPKARSRIWGEARHEEFSRLGEMPVTWKKDMADSYFSETYYREAVLSHIDNLNTFYVAATRAVEELHIFLHGTPTFPSINTLIRKSFLPQDDHTVCLGSLPGHYETQGDRTVFSFGKPIRKTPPPRTVLPKPAYPVSRPEARIRIRLDSQRYADSGSGEEVSPRNYGIMMHKVFEQIENYNQIDDILSTWTRNGLLTPVETTCLQKKIDEAFQNPVIKSWFDPKWEMIRNEQDIIVPGESRLKRPDRVVVKGREALVIDYKFGETVRKSYENQIRGYLELLRNMGYTQLTGYIWYVQKQTVETITV